MTQATKKRITILSVLALWFITMVRGSSFIFIAHTLDAGMSPASTLFGRFTLAAVVMVIVFGRTIRREYQKGQWKSGAAIGALLFVAFSLQTIAQKFTTPANNAFLTGLYVVLVPFLWWIFAKRRPAGIMFVACIISFAGAGILALNVSAGFSINPGDALSVVGAALFAGQIVATGILAKTMHPAVLTFFQFAVAAALALVHFLITDGNFSIYLQKEVVIGTIYLGLLCTCVCYFLQTVALKHIESTNAAIIMATESLFGALFSVLSGYDPLSSRMVIGGAAMFIAVILPEVHSAIKSKRGVST